MSPDQLDITVHQNTVILRGKREAETMDKDAIPHRRERAHGPFTRTVTLPFRVDADKVGARFDRGVLTLELPRPEIGQAPSYQGGPCLRRRTMS